MKQMNIEVHIKKEKKGGTILMAYPVGTATISWVYAAGNQPDLENEIIILHTECKQHPLN